MIRLSISSGQLHAHFSMGEAVPDSRYCGKCDAGYIYRPGDDFVGRRCDCNPREAPGALPAETSPPEDTGGSQIAQTCRCELASAPGTHPICDVFWASILHESLCITCHHAEACHS